MHSDVRGYYATLGIQSDATAADIKAAYRRLAKLNHPDSNLGRDDNEFKRINEAYSTLSNPELRANYDNAGVVDEEIQVKQRERLDPLRCSQCGKITAQPRYIIFWRVFSLIIFTSRVPIQGLFCARCAKREALKSTTFTAALGWWGIPWGPIWTIANGFKNAIGGEHEKERDEKLAWYNVVAFIQAREIPVAYGLAERLLSSQDREISTAAADFTSLCRANGFQPKGQLKDTWGVVRGQAPIRMVILSAAPLLLLSLFLMDETSASPTPAYEFAAENDYIESPSEALDSKIGGDPEPLVISAPEVACSTSIENGAIFGGRENLIAEGHDLTIDNGTSGDAIVKVRSNQDDSVVAYFFVESGQSATLSGLADGTYKFQYAIGDQLGSDCSSFIGNYRVSEFPSAETFLAEYVNDYRGEGYVYQELSYTLFPVAGGNVRPVSISPEEFNTH